jgi:hypothetical protein
MAHERRAFFLVAAALTGCATQTLPATDSFSQQIVGTWRATLSSDAQSFSDYVFGDAGALATLRTVVDGKTVPPMQGAGVITSTDGQTSCAFGDAWRTTDTQVIVDGTCTDGTERDIELDFDQEAVALASVSVMAVGGESAWMKPITWRFEDCALKSCE